ncbi:integrase arm-type DNA-binding domain-containing protein [Erythrobacter sp.]|uniref:tyrosine-type recombinase/integrase n=1 Tax=Erythrobacter sp. TaxID=1042 RepID=UPI0025EE4C26|nr:integrase arm-type DNA-binding domain-containing protein [Erythrobacter sp.]
MLTDAQARQAKAKDKDYKLSDSGGLYLFVSKTGHKSWRLKYRYLGKEKRLMIGTYPAVRLSDARSRRDSAKLALKEGRDPQNDVKKQRLANEELASSTFEKYARDWWKVQKPRWRPVHAEDVLNSMERDLFPKIGDLPIHELNEPVLLGVLEKVEERGAIETAHRLRQRIERVIRYAKAKGVPIVGNPATDIKEAMSAVPKRKKWPALTKVEDVRALIRKIDTSSSYPVTRLASRFLALVSQRPGMVHRLKWDHLKDVDWSKNPAASPNAHWYIDSEEMKLEFDRRGDEEFDHDVPLSPQALEALVEVRKLTGLGPYVFPNCWNSHAPMSENALNSLYRRRGFQGKHVPHGWRTSFSTIMNEKLERGLMMEQRFMIDRLIIDIMLAHLPTGMSAEEFAYNRARFAERRRELACEWADLILEGAVPVRDLVSGRRRRVD